MSSDGTRPARASAPGPAGGQQPAGPVAISYRVDDFAGFRRALLRPLPGEQALGVWRPAPGDLGLQVLEWWAYLGDVLTFYNERIANESYLRTATQPASIADLVALLGYQPAPGMAATGQVAAMRRLPARPSRSSSRPACSWPAPPPPASRPDLRGRPTASFTGPSSLPVTLAPGHALTANADGTAQSVLLAGRSAGSTPGTRLLLVGQRLRRPGRQLVARHGGQRSPRRRTRAPA